MHAASLRYVVKVAELGSFRRAAEELNVAASAISRQVQLLEYEFGAQLFERSVSGVKLTAEGQLLLRHVTDTLTGYRNLVADIASLRETVVGEVRIIGLASVVESILPDEIASLLTVYPSLDIRVVESHPSAAADGLRQGEHDIGLFFVGQPFHDIDLVGELKTSIGAVMRADHPLAARERVTLTDCTTSKAVMFTERWMIQDLMNSEFQRTGATLQPRIVSNSMSVVRAAIRAGVGIGFVTPLGFMDEIERGEIVHIPLADSPADQGRLGIFVRRGLKTSRPVSVTLARLLALFSELQARLDAPSSTEISASPAKN